MFKTKMAILENERVRLRPLSFDDLPTTLAWRNQDSVRKWFFHSDLVGPEQHLAWFNSYQNKDNDFVFIVEEKVVFRKAVGQVALYHIDWSQRRAEFGRLVIGELEARGIGLAKEATRLLLEFAEKDLMLNEIYLETYENNSWAIALYHSCGFRGTEKRDGVVHMVRTA